jgi:hypothetical protein
MQQKNKANQKFFLVARKIFFLKLLQNKEKKAQI